MVAIEASKSDGWVGRWWVSDRKSVEADERNGESDDRFNSVTGDGCCRCTLIVLWLLLLAPLGFFSICWCWERREIRLTCTGIGTTSFCEDEWWWVPVECWCWWCESDCEWCWWLECWPAPFILDGPPVTKAALTLFHFARRFWNHILIWTSDKRNWWAICERSVKLRYFLAWNSRSSSINWCVEKAVRRRRFLLLPPPPACEIVASMELSDEVTTTFDVAVPKESTVPLGTSLQPIELMTG